MIDGFIEIVGFAVFRHPVFKDAVVQFQNFRLLDFGAVVHRDFLRRDAFIVIIECNRMRDPLPVGGVMAVSEIFRGDGDRFSGHRVSPACPAGENIAGARGINRRDWQMLVITIGVFVRIGFALRQATAGQIVGDGKFAINNHRLHGDVFLGHGHGDVLRFAEFEPIAVFVFHDPAVPLITV